MKHFTKEELNLTQEEFNQLRQSEFSDTHELASFLLKMPKFLLGQKHIQGASFTRTATIPNQDSNMGKNTCISIWN
jgi:hypothetical protein